MHPNQRYPNQTYQYNSYQQNVPAYQGIQQSSSAYTQGNNAQYTGPSNSAMPNQGLQNHFPTHPSAASQASAWNSAPTSMGSSWNPTRASKTSCWNSSPANTSSPWNSIPANKSSSWNSNPANTSSSWNSNPANTSSSLNPNPANTSSSWNSNPANTSSSWNSNPANTSSSWNSNPANTSSSLNPNQANTSLSWNPSLANGVSSWNPKEQTSIYPPPLVSNQQHSASVPTRSQYGQGQQMGKRPASSEMFSQQQSKKPRLDTGQSMPYAVEVNGYQEGIHIHGNCYVTLTNDSDQAKPPSSMDGHLNVSVRPVVNTASVMNPVEIDQLRSPSKLHKIGIIMNTLMSVVKKYLPLEYYAKITSFMNNNGCLAKILPDSLCQHLLKYEESTYVCNCIHFYKKYKEGMCLLIGRGKCNDCAGAQKNVNNLDETSNVLAIVNTVKQTGVVSSKPANHRSQSVTVSKNTGAGPQQTLPSIGNFCNNNSSPVNVGIQPYQANYSQATAPAVHRQVTNSANMFSVSENKSSTSRQSCQLQASDRINQGRLNGLLGIHQNNTQQVPQNFNSQPTSRIPQQIPENFTTRRPTSIMQNHGAYAQQCNNYTQSWCAGTRAGPEAPAMPAEPGRSWDQTSVTRGPASHYQTPITGFSTYFPYTSSGSQAGNEHHPVENTNANLLRWNAVQEDYVRRDHWQEDKKELSSMGPTSGGLSIGKWHVPETESVKMKVTMADGPAQKHTGDKNTTNKSKTSLNSESLALSLPVESQESTETLSIAGTLPHAESLPNLSRVLPIQQSTMPKDTQPEEDLLQCFSLKPQEVNTSQNNAFEKSASSVCGTSGQSTEMQLPLDLHAKAQIPPAQFESEPSITCTSVDVVTSDKQCVPAPPVSSQTQKRAHSIVHISASVKPPQLQNSDVVIILDSDDESEVVPGCADSKTPKILSEQCSLTPQIDSSSVGVNKSHQGVESAKQTSQVIDRKVSDSPWQGDDQFWNHLIQDTTDRTTDCNRTTVEAHANNSNNTPSSAGPTEPSVGDDACIIDKDIASEESTAADEPALNFESLFSDGAATFTTFTLDESDDEIEMTTVEIGKEDWEKMTHS